MKCSTSHCLGYGLLQLVSTCGGKTMPMVTLVSIWSLQYEAVRVQPLYIVTVIHQNHIHLLTNGVVQSFADIGLLLLPRPQHHAAWQLQRGGGHHASGTCKNWSSHDRGRS